MRIRGFIDIYLALTGSMDNKNIVLALQRRLTYQKWQLKVSLLKSQTRTEQQTLKTGCQRKF